MEFGIIVIFFLLVAPIIMINYAISVKMENAAIDKGHCGKAAFYMSFFLSFVGYIYVAALPDLKKQKKLDKIIALLGGDHGENI